MRKFFIFSFLTLVIGTMMSCSSCNSKKDIVDDDTIQVVGTYNVENCVSTDRQSMFLWYGENYSWFETCITLNSYLDEENDGIIANLTNVFQVVTEREKGFDTKVVFIAYNGDERNVEEVEAFCVGDLPLNDKEIKVTFKDAFDKLMQANLPKPHSRQCVLRSELGPKPCNPQYVFGNTKAQVYVDAVTGDVTDKNPAFDGSGFTKQNVWP